MDKKALQSFALLAKDSLETQIKVSLKLLGIHSDKDIKKAYIQGDFTIIDGDSKTYPSDLKQKRDHFLELIKTDGYAYTIEQFAYTWFNRLIALRFMEVHDYLPHGFKVFPKGNGSIEPEILGKLTLVEKELNLDIDLCHQFKEKAQIEELYRYVLFQQCNALSGILPMLFSKEYSYLELMLPSTLLKGTTVITELIKIDESNFLEDVEVIGWLYQFYVSSDREEFRKAKVVNKDLIPTLTQIFTPDWIVRYMTENSLGRLWLESYPDSSVKKEFKYYVEDAEQTEEVKKQIESIRYKNVDPKDIKVIEPCSGSGHILVYAFDALMLMYEEKGYSKNDIPKLILDNNLFGLDVDKRASQLASFSLIMKARSIDSRFFQPSRMSYPKVFEIKDSKMLISMDYKKKLLDLNINDWKKDEHLSDEELKVVDYVIETFVDGKVIGSLLKVKRDNYVPLISKINHLHKVTIRGIFNGEFVEYGLKRIVQLLRLAEIMSRKYDVMITNPPYVGTSKLEKSAKTYLSDHYSKSKDDLFAIFMEVSYTKPNGFKSLVNPDSWMFLSSFERLRHEIMLKEAILSLCHLGMGSFDSVVQTTMFITRQFPIPTYKGTYFRLVNAKDKEKDFALRKNMHILDQSIYNKIPGVPIAYWISAQLISAFCTLKPLSEISIAKSGLSTGDNDKYLKLWYEVDFNSIGFNLRNNTEFLESCFEYVPCNKGGDYRKWYGNNEYVVRWSKSNEFHRPRTTYLDLYYKPAITWSAITTGLFNARFYEAGYLFDHAAASLFPHNSDELMYILGFINSKVAYKILNLLNPTINTGSDVLVKLPIRIDLNKANLINNLVNECIQICKEDWDSNETSWGFSMHPLLKYISSKISDSSNELRSEVSANFKRLKKNEEEINRIFIDIYDLSDQVDPTINEKENSISIPNKTNVVKSFISFLVGLSFGRFSPTYDENEYSNKSKDMINRFVDKEIICIFEESDMDIGLAEFIFKHIKFLFGNTYFKENLDYIADSLGKRTNESSEESINRYLMQDYYFDHAKMYKKRPIYWMLSSGKHKAFQCLIYMHKYTEDTLATINSQYLLPESTRLKYELNELNSQLVKADDKTRRTLEKEKVFLENKYNEIIEYGQVLDHMANRYISINLDDGVKVNYEKFQGIEIVTDSGTRIKKDLLVPIK